MIRLDIQQAVATLTFDRPEKLNAITPEMGEALRAHVTAINANTDIRAVVLTGAGAKSFCVGSDVGGLKEYATPWDFRNRTEYCDSIRALRPPVVAAVNGYALGGGLELALACDVRIASPNARFGAPEIKLGWIGGGGMTPMLVNAVGPSNAAYLVMTGDPVDAPRALAWGLVTEVADDVRARAHEIASAIAARAPIAAETAKLNLQAAQAMPLENAIRYERDLQTICFATEDAKEGRAAFAEKRAPRFTRS